MKDVRIAMVLDLTLELTPNQSTVVLCNHDVGGTARIRLSKTILQEEGRFDYGFYKALRWHRGLRGTRPDLGWTALRNVTNIYRGSAKSPVNATVLHTCDYHKGFWDTRRRSDQLQKDRSVCGIRRGDLLVKRVGRQCASSIGKVVGNVRTRCSDCVLIIRPIQVSRSTEILFSLRVLLASPTMAALTEKGTGATYLTASQLLNLSIPARLARRFPKTFCDYRRAIWRRNYRGMTDIENKVRDLISRYRKDGTNGSL